MSKDLHDLVPTTTLMAFATNQSCVPKLTIQHVPNLGPCYTYYLEFAFLESWLPYFAQIYQQIFIKHPC